MADQEDLDLGFELPEVWKDDQRMDVLFSPFRDNREINPQSWDTKHKFWSKLVTQLCRESSTLIFEPKTIHLKFKRKGKTPVCLLQVLTEMLRNKTIIPVDDFRKSIATGWLSWGFNTFVKNPISWSLGAVVGADSKCELDGEYIHPELVKEKAVKLLCLLQENVKHKATDFVVYLTDVKKLASSFCADDSSLDLVILLLVKERKVTLSETNTGKKVLKFVHPGEKAVSAITEVQLGVLRLQNTHALLLSEVEKLGEEVQRSLQDAKYYISKGLRNSAKNALRRKKGQEKKLDQKECSLQVLTTLLEKIQDAESEKMILDAYQAGTAVMKQNVRDGLNIDRVEQTLDAVQEVLENQADITQVLSTSITDPSLDVSDSDLLAELGDILQTDEDVEDVTSQLSDFKIDSLPDVPNSSLNPEAILNTTFTVENDQSYLETKEQVPVT